LAITATVGSNTIPIYAFGQKNQSYPCNAKPKYPYHIQHLSNHEDPMSFSIIPFLLLAVPVAEIAVFILVGGQIGVLWTLALILFTAILGSILLRIQGFKVINRLRAETDAGRIPSRELGHGVMILVAGILLLTPGFVTDTLGFLLFVPSFRSGIWQFLASRVTVVQTGSHRKTASYGFRGSTSRHHDTNVVDLDPDEFKRKGNKDDKNPPWHNLPNDRSE
jgi:UPF0716 protein FxsA